MDLKVIYGIRIIVRKTIHQTKHSRGSFTNDYVYIASHFYDVIFCMHV